MPFYLCVCVCHPVHCDFVVVVVVYYGVRGRGKAIGTAEECSLHSYQVDGWMNGPMCGWMLLKNAEAHEARGREQQLDACLITVSLGFDFGVSLFFLKFLVQSYWRKGGVAQKILQT